MQHLREGENEESRNIIKENELKTYLDCDITRLAYPPIRFVIEDRSCQCGKIRSIYTHRFNSFVSPTAINQRISKSTTDILNVDKNAVYLTKKNLMLNQFLECTNDTQKVKVENPRNWFEKVSGSTVRSHCSSKNDKNTICSTATSILDKRFVNLLRGITLYWFICLNTILARSELLKKKGPIIFDDNVNAEKSVIDTISSTCASSFPLPCDSSESRVSLCLLENIEDVEKEFLWNLFRNTIVKECGLLNDAVQLPFDQHLRKKLPESVLRLILQTLIGLRRQSFAMQSSLPNICEIYKYVEYVNREELTRRNQICPSSTMLQRSFLARVWEKFFEKLTKPMESIENTFTIITASSTQRDATSPSDLDDQKFCLSAKEQDDDSSDVDWSSESSEESDSTAYPTTDVESDSEVCSEFENESTSIESGSISSEADESELMELINSDVLSAEVENSVPLDENRFFLPAGILNLEKEEYPLYNLWSSPLNSLDILQRDRAKSKVSSGSSTEDNFTPYQLWESSFIAATDKYAPKFSSELNIVSLSTPSQTKQPTHTDANASLSTYSLWGSPIMVDVQQLSNCDGNRFVSGSSKVDCRDEASEALKTHRQESFFSHGHGKYLLIKPVIKGFVSFTDRGAFEYYRKPPPNECNASNDCVPPSSSIRENVTRSWNIISESTNCGAENTNAELEVENVNESFDESNEVDEMNSSEVANSSYLFRPIQPAFKVQTDATPTLERSPSATYYYNKKKLFIFEHELDGQSGDPYLFQPKFAVSSNDKACQTDPVYNFPEKILRSTLQTHRPACYGEPSGTFIVSSQHNSNSRPLFYSLGDVFNYLGHPGLTNVGECSVKPLSSIQTM